MTEFPYQLDRTVLIQATPETVFRFFTDSARWAAWWGAGSTIEAQPGGKVYIRHPNGVEVVGEVLEVQAPERLAFTYGFAGGQPVAPGGSRVTLRLEAHQAGTRLHLRHEFREAAPRDQHVQGWRFQLSLFGNAVANEVYADAPRAVDAWFDAWAIPDETARAEILNRTVAPGIQFRDRYSLLDGLDDLMAHITAAQRFMPGIRMRRTGDIRHCQGIVLADWVASDGDGKVLVSGSTVFTFRPDGKLAAVTGFANPPSH